MHSEFKHVDKYKDVHYTIDVQCIIIDCFDYGCV